MKIKEVITKDKMSQYLDKFSLLICIKSVWRTVRRICIFISELKRLITKGAFSYRQEEGSGEWKMNSTKHVATLMVAVFRMEKLN